MEAQWQADRAMLRRLMQTQPQWTQRDYAQSIGRSVAWVKKWIKRRFMPAFGDAPGHAARVGAAGQS